MENLSGVTEYVLTMSKIQQQLYYQKRLHTMLQKKKKIKTGYW